MIGTGTTVAFELGLLLSVAQVPADIPEGFATIATFRRKNIARKRRLLLTALLAVPILLGATLGYWLLLGRPIVYRMAVLAFTAGLLLSVVVEEMIREAHRGEESRWDVLGLVGGFALFVLLACSLG
jgi:ZIP family zinc transporter